MIAEHYRITKTIEPNVLKARFRDKDDGFKMDHVKFRAMKDGDKEDYAFLNEHEIEYTKGTSNKLLGALTELDEGLSGYQITRLGHSLQSATRAERDGVDKDWIVSTLLHDIGDIFAPYSHDEYATSILRPFVREQCTWVVEKHADFQMVYYGRHVGADPNKREKHRGHFFFDVVSLFANVGIKAALIQNMTHCQSAILPSASIKSSPRDLTTPQSYALEFVNSW